MSKTTPLVKQGTSPPGKMSGAKSSASGPPPPLPPKRKASASGDSLTFDEGSDDDSDDEPIVAPSSSAKAPPRQPGVPLHSQQTATYTVRQPTTVAGAKSMAPAPMPQAGPQQRMARRVSNVSESALGDFDEGSSSPSERDESPSFLNFDESPDQSMRSSPRAGRHGGFGAEFSMSQRRRSSAASDFNIADEGSIYGASGAVPDPASSHPARRRSHFGSFSGRRDSGSGSNPPTSVTPDTQQRRANGSSPPLAPGVVDKPPMAPRTGSASPKARATRGTTNHPSQPSPPLRASPSASVSPAPWPPAAALRPVESMTLLGARAEAAESAARALILAQSDDERQRTLGVYCAESHKRVELHAAFRIGLVRLSRLANERIYFEDAEAAARSKLEAVESGEVTQTRQLFHNERARLQLWREAQLSATENVVTPESRAWLSTVVRPAVADKQRILALDALAVDETTSRLDVASCERQERDTLASLATVSEQRVQLELAERSETESRAVIDNGFCAAFDFLASSNNLQLQALQAMSFDICRAESEEYQSRIAVVAGFEEKVAMEICVAERVARQAIAASELHEADEVIARRMRNEAAVVEFMVLERQLRRTIETEHESTFAAHNFADQLRSGYEVLSAQRTARSALEAAETVSRAQLRKEAEEEIDLQRLESRMRDESHRICRALLEASEASERDSLKASESYIRNAIVGAPFHLELLALAGCSRDVPAEETIGRIAVLIAAETSAREFEILAAERMHFDKLSNAERNSRISLSASVDERQRLEFEGAALRRIEDDVLAAERRAFQTMIADEAASKVDTERRLAIIAAETASRDDITCRLETEAHFELLLWMRSSAVELAEHSAREVIVADATLAPLVSGHHLQINALRTMTRDLPADEQTRRSELELQRATGVDALRAAATDLQRRQITQRSTLEDEEASVRAEILLQQTDDSSRWRTDFDNGVSRTTLVGNEERERRRIAAAAELEAVELGEAHARSFVDVEEVVERRAAVAFANETRSAAELIAALVTSTEPINRSSLCDAEAVQRDTINDLRRNAHRVVELVHTEEPTARRAIAAHGAMNCLQDAETALWEQHQLLECADRDNLSKAANADATEIATRREAADNARASRLEHLRRCVADLEQHEEPSGRTEVAAQHEKATDAIMTSYVAERDGLLSFFARRDAIEVEEERPRRAAIAAEHNESFLTFVAGLEETCREHALRGAEATERRLIAELAGEHLQAVARLLAERDELIKRKAAVAKATAEAAVARLTRLLLEVEEECFRRAIVEIDEDECVRRLVAVGIVEPAACYMTRLSTEIERTARMALVSSESRVRDELLFNANCGAQLLGAVSDLIGEEEAARRAIACDEASTRQSDDNFNARSVERSKEAAVHRQAQRTASETTRIASALQRTEHVEYVTRCRIEDDEAHSIRALMHRQAAAVLHQSTPPRAADESAAEDDRDTAWARLEAARLARNRLLRAADVAEQERHQRRAIIAAELDSLDAIGAKFSVDLRVLRSALARAAARKLVEDLLALQTDECSARQGDIAQLEAVAFEQLVDHEQRHRAAALMHETANAQLRHIVEAEAHRRAAVARLENQIATGMRDGHAMEARNILLFEEKRAREVQQERDSETAAMAACEASVHNTNLLLFFEGLQRKLCTTEARERSKKVLALEIGAARALLTYHHALRIVAEEEWSRRAISNEELLDAAEVVAEARRSQQVADFRRTQRERREASSATGSGTGGHRLASLCDPSLAVSPPHPIPLPPPSTTTHAARRALFRESPDSSRMRQTYGAEARVFTPDVTAEMLLRDARRPLVAVDEGREQLRRLALLEGAETALRSKIVAQHAREASAMRGASIFQAETLLSFGDYRHFDELYGVEIAARSAISLNEGSERAALSALRPQRPHLDQDVEEPDEQTAASPLPRLLSAGLSRLSDQIADFTVAMPSPPQRASQPSSRLSSLLASFDDVRSRPGTAPAAQAAACTTAVPALPSLTPSPPRGAKPPRAGGGGPRRIVW